MSICLRRSSDKSPEERRVSGTAASYFFNHSWSIRSFSSSILANCADPGTDTVLQGNEAGSGTRAVFPKRAERLSRSICDEVRGR